MKQLATIGVVVLTLLGAAFYFSQDKTTPPEPDPIPEAPDIEPDTPDDGPIVSASADGTLTVRTAISNGYLMQGSTSDMYAAIDVEAVEHQGGERPPLNVAVVIDRSGSMAGEKIEHAKAAARRLVNVLGERDRIAVISYGSDVTVDFSSQPVTASTRSSLFRAINNIAIGGGTNLSGGFQRGFSEINKWKNADAVNRVILMSDGHANIGITNTQRLVGLSSNALSSKVSVSTIGVGLDYNEDLMTRMANEGAGNYYFVDKPNSIVGFLESEVKGLAATVAKNTAVVIKLGPGVTLRELHGFAHQSSGNQVYVSLAEFHSEEKKNILLKLNVDATKLGEKPIIETDISYDDVVKDKPTHNSLKLASVVTDDSEKTEKLVNVDVIARVQQVEVARTMEDAMNLWNDGNTAEAEKIIDSTQRRMRKRRAKYDFKGGERYDAVDKEMDEIKAQINSAPAKSTEGKRYIKKKKARSNAIFQAVDSF